MARPSSIPNYRRHSSGQARVTIDGKDHLLGPYNSPESREKYNRLVAEWLASAKAPQSAEAPAFTVNELCLAYWAHARAYYGFDHADRGDFYCIRDALRVVRGLYGRTPAREFGPKALKACRQEMLSKGWSRTYTNAQVDRVRRMFRWGAEEETVPGEVYQNLRAVAGLRKGKSDARETEAVRPVPEARVEAALPYMPPPVRTMVELQRLTGMRPGEAVVMRGCDLETGGKVWVYRPGSDRGPEGKHKTAHHGHRREVYIGPKAQEVLRPWLKPDLSAYLFSPAEAEAARLAARRKDPRSPMTPSQSARRPKDSPRRPKRSRYDPHSYRQAVVRACDRADAAAREALAKAGTPAAEGVRFVPQWHPNQLRHNAATALRKEFGIELARIVLGHSTAFTTEIYAEADRNQAMEVIGRVG